MIGFFTNCILLYQIHFGKQYRTKTRGSYWSNLTVNSLDQHHALHIREVPTQDPTNKIQVLHFSKSATLLYSFWWVLIGLVALRPYQHDDLIPSFVVVLSQLQNVTFPVVIVTSIIKEDLVRNIRSRQYCHMIILQWL